MKGTFVFFDVANTLLYKPQVYKQLFAIIEKENVNVQFNDVVVHHKRLSEIIKFPDKTNSEFYSFFNAELLLGLGIEPTEKLLDSLFNACTYLPWERFPDCDFIDQMDLPKGIISNWDVSLKDKIPDFFKTSFEPIIGSQEYGFSKPDPRIFEFAKSKLTSTYDKIIYVGDSIKLDVLPAKNTGFIPILIDRNNIYPYFNGNKITTLHELKKYL